MDLRHLTDKQLLKDTEALVQEERDTSTKILHHLKEIDRRKLFSDLKCSSLHDYCVRVLKFSEGDAQRKIQSSRLLADIPDLELKIERGELSLTNLASAASFFRQHDIKALEEKKEVLQQIENLTKKECEKKLFAISGSELSAKETQKRISEDKVKIIMLLSDVTVKKLERFKALIGKYPSNEELMEKVLDLAIAQVEKEKFKLGTRKSSPPPVEVIGRYIPTSMKEEIYRRDQQCTNCGSLFNLNYDHQTPFALGGKTSPENLRLLCFQCNQRARIRAKL